MVNMTLTNVSPSKSNGKATFLDKLKNGFSSKFDIKYKSNLSFELENLSTTDLGQYQVLSSYDVGEVKVYIAKDKTGRTCYLIDEPHIDKVGKAIFVKIMHFLYISMSVELKNDQATRIMLRKNILYISRKLGLEKYTVPIIDTLLYYVIRDSFGYGIIDTPMRDPDLEDIVEESFDKPVGVVHKKFGEYGILDTNIRFRTIEINNAFVQKIVQKTGKSMTAAVPYIDTITKEGHRIAATFGKEVSLPGPNFTIRKFSEKPFTITKLLELETMNAMVAAYLWMLIESKAFLLVIGSTAAGKTTTIGALSSLINPQMKITTIEDTPELRMGHTHWQRLITRKGTSMFSEKYEVTMNDLVRLSLRSRPDYIIVGEVRGEEISSLIQAVATGHGGLTSFHASDARAALARMKSPPMNVHLSGQMLISVILRQTRLVDPNGKITRKITEVTEVVPKEDSIELKKIIEWNAFSSRYKPENLDELLTGSYRLQEISLINGWTLDELRRQFVTRMEYLAKMLANNHKDFDVVTNQLEKFYYEPEERYA